MAEGPHSRRADREGVVDERPIDAVKPGDLRGFTQCHFFAGIGGWSLLCGSHSGPTTGQCGPEGAHANPSASPARRGGSTTREPVARVLPPHRGVPTCTVFGEQVAAAMAWSMVVLARPCSLTGASRLRLRVCGIPGSGRCSPQMRQAVLCGRLRWHPTGRRLASCRVGLVRLLLG